MNRHFNRRDSAVGHLRRLICAGPLYPRTDIVGSTRYFRKAPKPEISPNAKPLDARSVRFARRAEDTLCRLAAPWRPPERTWRTTASPADRPMSLASRRARSHVHSRGAQVVDRKPKYPRLIQM